MDGTPPDGMSTDKSRAASRPKRWTAARVRVTVAHSRGDSCGVIRQPSFADWYWWTIMTALGAVLGIVLYVVLQAEARGYSVVWVGLPLVVAYLGAPLDGWSKARYAPVALPALVLPTILVMPFYFVSAPITLSFAALSDLSARIGWIDPAEAQAAREIEAYRADPALAMRVRACERVVAPVQGHAIDPRSVRDCVRPAVAAGHPGLSASSQ